MNPAYNTPALEIFIYIVIGLLAFGAALTASDLVGTKRKEKKEKDLQEDLKSES